MLVILNLLATWWFVISRGHDTWVYATETITAKDPSSIGNYLISLAQAGATRLILCARCAQSSPPFASATSPVDQWGDQTEFDKASIVGKLHFEGTQLHLAVRDGDQQGFYVVHDPSKWARSVCGHAARNYYDGVVLDFVGTFSPAETSLFAEWVIEATSYCRRYTARVSHSAAPAYFSSAWSFVFDELVGVADNVLVQFYDQGVGSHTTYQSTWVRDDVWPTWTNITKRHPDAIRKFVVGKYIYEGMGLTGQFKANQLASGLLQAQQDLGYDSGVVLWRAPDPTDPRYQQFTAYDLPLISSRQNPSLMSGGSRVTALVA